MENHNPKATYVERVIAHESTKKGASAAVAGVLIAVISEALWPRGL